MNEPSPSLTGEVSRELKCWVCEQFLTQRNGGWLCVHCDQEYRKEVAARAQDQETILREQADHALSKKLAEEKLASLRATLAERDAAIDSLATNAGINAKENFDLRIDNAQLKAEVEKFKNAAFHMHDGELVATLRASLTVVTAERDSDRLKIHIAIETLTECLKAYTAPVQRIQLENIIRSIK